MITYLSNMGKRIFFILWFVLLINISYGQGTLNVIMRTQTTNSYTVLKKYPEQFVKIMESVLLFEGGFTDMLDDPGGATNMGVTQETYDRYRSDKKLTTRSVKMITMDEVYDCYYRYYYLPAKCHKLPPALSFVVFDTSVNFGVKAAKTMLNDCAILYGDSMLYDAEFALKYLDMRIAKRYEIVAHNIKKEKFLKGWLNRDKKVGEIILKYY